MVSFWVLALSVWFSLPGGKLDEGVGSIMHDSTRLESRGDPLLGVAFHRPAQWLDSDLVLQQAVAATEDSGGPAGDWPLLLPAAQEALRPPSRLLLILGPPPSGGWAGWTPHMPGAAQKKVLGF
jgi:hypothetical protein